VSVTASRIDELRRRVEEDPASLAFAALAEEYRRTGRLQQAVDTCRSGLEQHPEYVSARVTLGRALLELGEQDCAREEFERVIRLAPENLAAIRGLAEICRRPAEGVGAAGTANAGTPATAETSATAAVPAAAPAPPGAPLETSVLPAPGLAPPGSASPEQTAGLERFLEQIRRTRSELGR
jgi:tetratricopeptide (TPR) repeat protein